MSNVTFTPRRGNGSRRLNLTISRHEWEEFEREGRAVITDQASGNRYIAERAACPIVGCMCDAVAYRICTFNDCHRAVASHQLCSAHNKQRKAGRELQPIRQTMPKETAKQPCDEEGCQSKRVAWGLCDRHYRQKKYGRKPMADAQKNRKCTIDSCSKPAATRGWCFGHYRRFLRYGDPEQGRSRMQTGQSMGSDGYIYIHVDGKRVRHHRAVMEHQLGRPLLDHENVHHRNGDRTDNRLENLELWSTMQPSGQRIQDKLEFARQIVELYGDLEK